MDNDNGDLSQFSPGQRVHGEVIRLEHYGAYARLGPNLVGLALIPEISWDRIRHPSDAVRVGEPVDAEVLVVNPEHRKISLSLRR